MFNLSLLGAVAASTAWAVAIIAALVFASASFAAGFAIKKAVESIAKQPEADGKIRTTLLIGLVIIETFGIYALLISLLLIVL